MPVIDDNPSASLHCFAGEINTRWMKILQSIPDFSGMGDSVADLIRERDAYLRARAILREYDQFQVDFQKTLSLKRAISRLRRKANAFPGQCQKSIQPLAQRLHYEAILQQRFFHVLVRKTDETKLSKANRKALAQRLNETRSQLELLIPLASMVGFDLKGIVILFDRNVHQTNRLVYKDLEIAPLKPLPFQHDYRGINPETIGSEI